MRETNRTKRIVSWALTIALVLTLLPGMSVPAFAATAMTVTSLSSSTSGASLSSDTIYTVMQDVSITNGTAGGNGITIPANSTVGIYIATGKTLTVTGGAGKAGSGSTGGGGGGAGIYLPSTSTLILMGGGSLKVTGGAGGKAADGGVGGAGVVNKTAGSTSTPGAGGVGGGGAGGGGAGIGISGAAGGTGGAGGTSSAGSHDVVAEGNNGTAGTKGGNTNGATMGTLYCESTPVITATGGTGGAVADKGGNAGSNDKWNNNGIYYAGGGGGGGGGGAAANGNSYGSGGVGGGGGGGGGSGVRTWNGSNSTFECGGLGGAGGYTIPSGSNTTGGSAAWNSPEGRTRGDGGGGGMIGTSGSAGSKTNSLPATVYYRITYNMQNGSGGTATRDLYFGGATPSITAPTRTGYTFGGYYTGTGGTGTQVYTAVAGAVATNWTLAARDTTLYAKWTATIALDDNNGTGGSESVGVTYSSSTLSATLTPPTRIGYTFNGYWSAASGGVQVLGANLALVSVNTAYTNASGQWTAATVPATLYAQWTPNKYDVALDLDANGGDTGSGSTEKIYELFDTGYYLDSDTKTEMTTTTNKIILPTNKGYDFAGYYTDKAGRGIQYINADGYITPSAQNNHFTANGTLYAKWVAKEYTVAFVMGGALTNAKGSDSNPAATTGLTGVTYGKSLQSTHSTGTIVQTPRRENMVFLGYYSIPQGSAGTAVQYITADGNATSQLWVSDSDNPRLYAYWEATPYQTQILNGSFESPAITSSYKIINDARNTNDVYWLTTASDQKLELGNIKYGSPHGATTAADGVQYAELNANVVGSLYQTVSTYPNTTLQWGLSHRGRGGTDVMQVWIGTPEDVNKAISQYLSKTTTTTSKKGKVTTTTVTNSVANVDEDLLERVQQAICSSGGSAWKEYTGTYQVGSDQTETMFAFISVSSSGGVSYGNLLDNIYFQTNVPKATIPTRINATSNRDANILLDGVVVGTVTPTENLFFNPEVGTVLSIDPIIDEMYETYGAVINGTYYDEAALKNGYTIAEDTESIEITILIIKKGIINLNLAGGEEPTITEITLSESDGNTTYTVETPSRYGYAFKGWVIPGKNTAVVVDDTVSYTIKNSGTDEATPYLSVNGYEVNANDTGLVLMATWEKITLPTVTFALDFDNGSDLITLDGTSLYKFADNGDVDGVQAGISLRLDEGFDKDNPLTLGVPVREGYSFEGWALETTKAYDGTENIVYSVSEAYTGSYKIGSTAEVPLTEDVTISLKALWEANQISLWLQEPGASDGVSFIGGSHSFGTEQAGSYAIGSGDGEVAPFVVNVGNEGNRSANGLRATSSTGDFTAAYTGGELSGEATGTITVQPGADLPKGEYTATITVGESSGNAADNVSFTVSFTVTNPSVTLNLDGGTRVGADVTEYAPGTATTLPTATKVGWVFADWLDSSDNSVVATIPAGALGDKTYTAQWTQCNHSNPTTAATCTTDGACSCGVTLYATGHDFDHAGHTSADGCTIVAATCITKATHTFACLNGCGTASPAIEVGDVDSTAHNCGNVQTTAASCTDNGETYKVCQDCGQHETQSTLTATGHDYEVTETVTSGCTTVGSYKHVCKNCGDIYYTYDDANGHQLPEDWETQSAAKCGVSGLKYRVCTAEDCGFREEAVIDALAHSWNSGVETTAPKCTTAGLTTFSCAHGAGDACAQTYTTVIPATGHSASAAFTHACASTECTSSSDTHWKTCTNANCDVPNVKLEENAHNGTDPGYLADYACADCQHLIRKARATPNPTADETTSVTYDGSAIDTVTKSSYDKDSDGTPVYRIKSTTGEGTIDPATGVLTVTKAGDFVIEAITPLTEQYTEGEKEYTIKVGKGKHDAPDATGSDESAPGENDGKINVPDGSAYEIKKPNGDWETYDKDEPLPPGNYEIRIKGDDLNVASEAVPITILKAYKITYITSGGTAIPAGQYYPGTGATLSTLTTRTGFTFGGWTEDARDSSPTIITAIPATATGNKNVYALWGETKYTVTTTVDGSNGEIGGGGQWAYNSTVSITVTPSSGYQLKSLTYKIGTGTAVNVARTKDAEGNVSYTFTMPAADVTVTAAFGSFGEVSFIQPVLGAEAATATSAMTVDHATAGTPAWSPNLSSDGEYFGETVYSATVVLTAETGYDFDPDFWPETGNNGEVKSVTFNESFTTATVVIQYPETAKRVVSGLTDDTDYTDGVTFDDRNNDGTIEKDDYFTYMTGDKLDLSDVVVTVSYNDASSTDMTVAELIAAGAVIKIDGNEFDPATGILKRDDGESTPTKIHDGKKVTITLGDKSVELGTLTVYDPPVPYLTALYTISVTATEVKGYVDIAVTKGTNDFNYELTIGETALDASNAALGSNLASKDVSVTGLTPGQQYTMTLTAADATTGRSYKTQRTFTASSYIPSDGFDLEGKVLDKDGNRVMKISLEKGLELLQTAKIAISAGPSSDGKYTYSFKFEHIQPGIYNLVVDNGEWLVTYGVIMDEEGKVTPEIVIDMGTGYTQSVIEHSPTAPVVVADGMPEMFENPTDTSNMTDTEKLTAETSGYTDVNALVVASNGMVEIMLIVGDEEDFEDGDEKKLCDIAAIENKVVGAYMELSLVKSIYPVIGADASETYKMSVIEPQLLKLTVDIPENVAGKKGLAIIRLHNGTAEPLPLDGGEGVTVTDERYSINDEGTVATLWIYKFSPYAFIHDPDPQNPGNSGNPGGTPSNPENNLIIEDATGGDVDAQPSNPKKGDTVVLKPKTEDGFEFDSIVIRDKDGKDIPYTMGDDGTISFVMPEGKVTVTPRFKRTFDVSGILNTADHFAYLHGYPSGNFGPKDNMTRAEMAQMFYNLLLDKDIAVTSTFPDVPSSAWYAEAVNVMASLGIVAGYPDGNYGPQDPITRAQFATVVVRFTQVTGQSDTASRFTDVSKSHWAYSYIGFAYELGLISGVNTEMTLFAPDRNITRAEAATMVNRILGRSADENAAETWNLKRFPDVDKREWYWLDVIEATNDHDWKKDGDDETWLGGSGN